MNLLKTTTEAQSWADRTREAGRTIALVPTMGALHEGHLELVRQAKRRGDEVVVSIYVNPTQFGPQEDFTRYPRTLEKDVDAVEAICGPEVAVFTPSDESMYPDGPARQRIWVDVEELDDHLCGEYRPGHFRGVATIVAKLFLATKPHVAVFGLKDAQQFLVIKRMVRDLGFDVRIVGVPTVRESDGLAMSSRNRYLEDSHREQAVVLQKAVFAARERILAGEQRSEAIVNTMRSALSDAPDARVQYVEVVDVDEVKPLERVEPGQEVLAAVAVFFGSTRLIDNVFVRAPA